MLQAKLLRAEEEDAKRRKEHDVAVAEARAAAVEKRRYMTILATSPLVANDCKHKQSAGVPSDAQFFATDSENLRHALRSLLKMHDAETWPKKSTK